MFTLTKFEDQELKALVYKDRRQTQLELEKHCFNSFKTFESISNNVKQGQCLMNWMMFSHQGIVALTAEKKRYYAPYYHWKWQVDSLPQSKIWNNRHCSQNQTSISDSTLRLVGSTERNLLWAA